MHDFVVLTVKLDLEVNNSLKSRLFILYSRYTLCAHIRCTKLISDEAFIYCLPPKTPCGKKEWDRQRRKKVTYGHDQRLRMTKFAQNADSKHKNSFYSTLSLKSLSRSLILISEIDFITVKHIFITHNM